MTHAETILWRTLRNRSFAGEKFRRQVPVGPYIADFASISSKLIVELDGPPHNDPEQKAHDLRRDAFLRRQGWRVVRMQNEIAIGIGDMVLERIKSALNIPSSDPR